MRQKAKIWVVDFLRGILIFLSVTNNGGWVSPSVLLNMTRNHRGQMPLVTSLHINGVSSLLIS